MADKQSKNPQPEAVEQRDRQANTSQNQAADGQNTNDYGIIGMEEVDMLLMEDEDALDYDNSMYMDTTDEASAGDVDFKAAADDFYVAAEIDHSYWDAITAADYADALDTVDIFAADYAAATSDDPYSIDTSEADADFAESYDAGVSWADRDPLAEAQAEQDYYS